MPFNWFKSNSKLGSTTPPKSPIHKVLGTYINVPVTSNEEEAVFGCGCFWGAEKGFWKLPGVITTAVGYSGGTVEFPSYEAVCSGKTGHTEVVRVVWDGSIIDFSDLIKLFWECHDPTQGNRQGNDRGSQYRSAIFTTNERQLKLAIASKDAYQKRLNDKGFKTITTQIDSNQTFYFAEDYHQQYLARPGSRPYCSAMPTKVTLREFPGSNYKLGEEIWYNFDWEIQHCVLRSDNKPIKQ